MPSLTSESAGLHSPRIRRDFFTLFQKENSSSNLPAAVTSADSFPEGSHVLKSNCQIPSAIWNYSGLASLNGPMDFRRESHEPPSVANRPISQDHRRPSRCLKAPSS